MAPEQALQSFERALSFQPTHQEAMAGRGIALLELRNYAAAETALNTALAMKPGNEKVLAHRGRLHLWLRRLDQAKADVDAALALAPTLELALRTKVSVSLITHNVTQAMVACQKLLELNPKSVAAINLMGACFASHGEIAAAIAHSIGRWRSSRISRLRSTRRSLRWISSRARISHRFRPRANIGGTTWRRIRGERSRRGYSIPKRRLVVGYVSADFRRHSAGFIFMPVLRHRDHANFKWSVIPIVAVAGRHDRRVPLIRGSLGRCGGDVRRAIDGSHRGRRVDILVDLSGHSVRQSPRGYFRASLRRSRYRPGGAPTGTGLKTIDYIFADPVTIPKAARSVFAETHPRSAVHADDIRARARLYGSTCRCCATATSAFGTFNRIDKMSDEVLAVWSTLCVHCRDRKSSSNTVRSGMSACATAWSAAFVEHGVARDSVVCMGASLRDEHLGEYAKIDISLDTFPQNGGAGTWESLHMGVPVIAKLGLTTSGRAAGGIIKAIGLDDWVAEDDETYVVIAKRFAADPAALAALRQELPAPDRGLGGGQWRDLHAPCRGGLPPILAGVLRGTGQLIQPLGLNPSEIGQKQKAARRRPFASQTGPFSEQLADLRRPRSS